jgi:predicted ATPase
MERHSASFVGRQSELAELRHVLRESRLLSLTGAGGVGKSRLALRLVRDCLDEYQDGVWLIDLAPRSQGRLWRGTEDRCSVALSERLGLASTTSTGPANR